MHRLLWRSCSHICDPPHSLHSLLRRLCSHLPEGILAGSASANWVSLGCSPGRTDDQRVFTARSPQKARRRSVQARRGRTSCALHASTSVCVVVPVLNLSPDASLAVTAVGGKQRQHASGSLGLLTVCRARTSDWTPQIGFSKAGRSSTRFASYVLQNA